MKEDFRRGKGEDKQKQTINILVFFYQTKGISSLFIIPLYEYKNVGNDPTLPNNNASLFVLFKSMKESYDGSLKGETYINNKKTFSRI